MKKFNSFEQANLWLLKLQIKMNPKVLRNVAEEVYKDSDEYTYRDTGFMYDTGALYSDFAKGKIVEQTPYVRMRYYVGGKAGSGNRRAETQWFEVAMLGNLKKYRKMVTKIFNQQKKG